MRAISLKEVGIKEIDIRDKSVEISMIYDVSEDGASSTDVLRWKTKLDNPDLEAHKIVQEIKKKVKRTGEILPAEITNTDYDKKLVKFLNLAKDKTGTIFNMTTAEGYLKLVDDIKNMKSEF